MKSWPFFSKFVIAISPTLATALLALASRFSPAKFSHEFFWLIGWITILCTLNMFCMLYLHRRQNSLRGWEHAETNSRNDLWFRLIYQTPFIAEIRRDAQEQIVYSYSILRKLDGLADHYRKFANSSYCSKYIGCLAFCANEKRANIPWELFRDALVANFAAEILTGEIAPHVIADHYKGKWDDLTDAARRKIAETT